MTEDQASVVEHEFYAVAGRVLAAWLALSKAPDDPSASRDMDEAYMFLRGMTCVLLEVGCPPGLDRATVEAVEAWSSSLGGSSQGRGVRDRCAPVVGPLRG
jgi:hypothetical protein